MGTRAIHVVRAAAMLLAAAAISADAGPSPIEKLRSMLLVRYDAAGTAYNEDGLDPLLWQQTRYLVTGGSHAAVIAALDQFLASPPSMTPAEKLVLQRDLWAVFDWTARDDKQPGERAALRVRLSRAIALTALNAKQIEALPSNFRQAIDARAFPTAFDPAKPSQAFLPPDLFDHAGPWAELSSSNRIAPSHLNSMSSRSTFRVFINFPEGRAATKAYIESISSKRDWPFDQFNCDGASAATRVRWPQMPAGTQVLLLRQALHVSPDGTLLPTRLIESVQVRIMRDTTSEGQSKKEAQAFFEIELHPSRYARGEHGLGVAANDEKFYPIFQTFERDEFDNPQEPRTNAVERGSTCLGCHRLAGIEGMNSLTRSFTARGPRPEPISVIDGREQFGVDGFKGERRDWGLLQGMLEAHRAASTQPAP